jgi:hypothetical protein
MTNKFASISPAQRACDAASEQITEITPTCSALRHQTMCTRRLVMQIAEGRADPKDKPIAVIWKNK